MYRFYRKEEETQFRRYSNLLEEEAVEDSVVLQLCVEWLFGNIWSLEVELVGYHPNQWVR